MATKRPIPAELAGEAEVLFQALRQCPHLLQVGRAFGLRVGLSKGLSDQMRDRHGDESLPVVANCVPIQAP